MIDTDKYEGHTKGNNEVGWRVNNNFVSNGECPNDVYIAYVRPTGRVVLYPKQDVYEVIEFSDADAQLIADAPLLLAEVKRLKEIIGMFDEFICNNWMPSNSYPYAPSPFDNVHSLWNELLWRAEEE